MNETWIAPFPPTPWGRPRPLSGARRQRTCLLTTPHDGRTLSRVLADHLGREMPELRFVRRADGPGTSESGPDAVWLCGYQPGDTETVLRLRERHPDATIVVTGRGPAESWRGPALAAGADLCCSWPLPVEDLRRVLLDARHHAPISSRASHATPAGTPEARERA